MILLASKSPRRHELLKMLDIPFKFVDLKDVKETYNDELTSEEIPKYLSQLKANDYKDKLKDDELLITADTLVALGDKIMGKPSNLEEARHMLRQLSGKIHNVITGVTISSNKTSITFSSITEVKFAKLSDETINYYINNYHPLDKAGAYGIQEWIGAIGIESIKGSYYNVMGLPIHQLYKELLPFIQGVELSPHNDI